MGDPVNIVMENVKVNLADIKGVNWPVCFACFCKVISSKVRPNSFRGVRRQLKSINPFVLFNCRKYKPLDRNTQEEENS